MPVKKMGTRREWSSSDERELKALVRQKTPARLIGRRLKRTEGAVRQKAFQMGYIAPGQSRNVAAIEVRGHTEPGDPPGYAQKVSAREMVRASCLCASHAPF